MFFRVQGDWQNLYYNPGKISFCIQIKQNCPSKDAIYNSHCQQMRSQNTKKKEGKHNGEKLSMGYMFITCCISYTLIWRNTYNSQANQAVCLWRWLECIFSILPWQCHTLLRLNLGGVKLAGCPVVPEMKSLLLAVIAVIPVGACGLPESVELDRLDDGGYTIHLPKRPPNGPW